MPILDIRRERGEIEHMKKVTNLHQDRNKRMKRIATDKKLVSFCERVHPWKLMSVKSPTHSSLYLLIVFSTGDDSSDAVLAVEDLSRCPFQSDYFRVTWQFSSVVERLSFRNFFEEKSYANKCQRCLKES